MERVDYHQLHNEQSDNMVMEVTIVSAKNLIDVRYLGKMRTYAVAWIDPIKRRATYLDTKGGINPTWNTTLMIALPEHTVSTYPNINGTLIVEIFNNGYIGHKSLGSVTIPLSEILPNAIKSPNKLHFYSYQIQAPSGSLKGVLNISIRLKENEDHVNSKSTKLIKMDQNSIETIMASSNDIEVPYIVSNISGANQTIVCPYDPQQHYNNHGKPLVSQPLKYDVPTTSDGSSARKASQIGFKVGLIGGALGGLVSDLVSTCYNNGYGDGYKDGNTRNNGHK